MVGAIIMTHGDDRGLRLPPSVAPVQVVIVPIYKSDDERGAVVEVASKLRDDLVGNGVRTKVDDRDQHRPGFKFSEWELKGVPLRFEIGPRDVAAQQAVVADRISGEKRTAPLSGLAGRVAELLEETQQELRADALRFRGANTHAADDYDSLRDGIEAKPGFWVGPWCGELACEEKVAIDTKATIRYLPIEREDPDGACVVCGNPGTERATWARAY